MLNICMLTYKEMRLYKDSTLCQKEWSLIHSHSRSSFLLAHEFEPPFILSLFRLTVLAYHPDVSLYIRRFPAVLDNYDSSRTSTFPSSSGILWIRIEK